MSVLHLVYQHWFITCLLLWAVTATVGHVVRVWRWPPSPSNPAPPPTPKTETR